MTRMHTRLSAVAVGLVAAGFGFGADKPGRVALPDPDAGRLDVSAVFGQDGGKIISRQDRPDGTKELHGVQVVLGPRNWMKEYAVYNQGVVEQRTEFYPNGREFRFQRREHNGDGYELVYAPSADEVIADKDVPGGKISVQETLCHGTVRADKRWGGSFLVWEAIPGEFGIRLARHEYRDGELIKSTPFSAEKLGLPQNTTRESWPWELPNWPIATR